MPGYATRVFGRKANAVAASVALVSVFLSGCAVTATHEKDSANLGYSSLLQVRGGSFQRSSDRAYDGSWSAKATLPNLADQPGAATGAFSFDVPANYKVYYGAAFYLSPGTLQSQQWAIDILRWDNEKSRGSSGDYGGIMIDNDHKLRLVRGHLNDGVSKTVDALADPLTLAEGCWNFIAVGQKLSDKPAGDPGHAVSEVYLNGHKAITTDEPSAYGSGANRFLYGPQAVYPYGSPPLTVYVDNSFLNDEGPPAPSGNTCDPPRARFNSAPSQGWVPDGGGSLGATTINAIKSTDDATYIGGDFRYLGPPTGSFVSLSKADGSYDPGYADVGGTDPWDYIGSVYASAPDGQGGYYIGGDFKYVNGQPRSRLAHIKSDGRLDPYWNPGADNTVYAIAYDGRDVYVGGWFEHIGGSGLGRLAKLNPTTGAVSGWNPNPSGSVRALAFSASGSLYVGGDFRSIGTQRRLGIAELDKALGTATAWNPNLQGSGSFIAAVSIVATPGTVYIGGNFSSVDYQPRNQLAAIDAGTGVPTSWSPDADGVVYALTLSGSRLYAGGSFSHVGSEGRNGLAAIDLGSGSVLPWDPSPSSGSTITVVAVDGTTVYAGGYFTSIGGQPRRHLAALDSSTAQASPWSPAPGGAVETIQVSSGRVFAGGDFRSVNTVERHNLAALDPKTGAATSWAPDPNGPVNALDVADEKLYVGGDFSTMGGQARSKLASFDLPGPTLSAWSPNVSGGQVKSLDSANGWLYAAGSFSSIDGVPRNGTASWVARTGALTAWNPWVNAGALSFTKLVSSERLLYVVDSAGAIRWVAPRFVVASDANIVRPNGRAGDITAQGDLLYVAGDFSSIHDSTGIYQPRSNLAALKFTGTNASITPWNPSPNGPVDSIATDGRNVFVGGRFSQVGGKNRSGLAALDLESGAASPFGPSVGWSLLQHRSVYALDVSKERIYAGGDFDSVNRRSYVGLARFDSPGVLLDPEEGERTRKRLTLRPKAYDSRLTSVGLQYRVNVTDPWTTVPSQVLRDGRNAQLSDGTASTAGGQVPTIVWDMPSTPGIDGKDGSYQVRAIFTGSGSTYHASDPVKVQLDQKAPGTADAVEQVGPGSVDLLTGNFTLSRDDVGIKSYISDLSVSRSYNSRDPSVNPQGPFGPGWRASLPVDSAGSAYVKLVSSTFRNVSYETDEDGEPIEIVDEGELVTITTSDGTKFTFKGYDGTYYPEPGSEDLDLRHQSDGSFRLEDLDRNVTIFTQPQPGGSEFVPSEIRQPGSATTTTFGYKQVLDDHNNPHWRVSRAIAPIPQSASCDPASPPKDCRSLSFVYAQANSSGLSDTQWGDYQGRLVEVRLTAYSPSAGVPVTDAVAHYYYDWAGRLRAEWDPRISPALKETYDYDSNGRLSRVTPPGLQPWAVNYGTIAGDPNAGRLASVSRDTPQGTAIWTMAYQVPVSGSGAPYAMGQDDVGRWGQTDIPTDATAIFPPDQLPSNPPTSYSRADVHYLDRKAREVNVTTPGGFTTTTEWDQHNNLVRELSAQNRERALATGSLSAAYSRFIDTERTYGADGLEMRSELGPLHKVELDNGQVTNARQHTSVRYDEGIPEDVGEPHLPTTQTVSARLNDGSDTDARVTKLGYDGNGWSLRKPTSTTVDATPGGLNLTTKVFYDSTTSLETERRMPANPNGGDAHAIKTIYYGASAPAGCAADPEWTGLPCRKEPAAQPGTSGLPDLPPTVFGYNRLLEVTQATDLVGGGTTRQVNMTYDAAGRPRSQSVTSSVGSTVPPATIDYDPATGLPTRTTTSTSEWVEHTYDSLGRIIRYKDAEGNISTTSYDLLGRPSVTSDGKGTQTNTYDPQSGLLVRLDDSAAGTFTATYDADGKVVTESVPNGLQAQTTYDETGSPVRLRYEKRSGPCGSSCTWFDDSVTESIQGQWMHQDSTLSSQDYSYDQAGRLTQVEDTLPGSGCTTRSYAYDADSNRTRMTTRAPGGGGACDTSAAGTVVDHTYDAGDRITDAGYTYDSFGRITRVPGRDAGGQDLSATYYQNDLVRSLTQNGVTLRNLLDPLRRVRVRQISGQQPDKPDETFHYADDSDSPAWSEQGTRWQRYIEGIGGDLAAVQDSQSGVELQLGNLHGDVVATASLDVNATKPLATFESTEFGVPRQQDAQAPGRRYDWLGQKQRRSDLPSGVVEMGVRVYVPEMGRFLQTDPVPGGSANAYDYAGQDPVNSFDLNGRKCKTKGRGTSCTKTTTREGCSTINPGVSLCIRAKIRWTHTHRRRGAPGRVSKPKIISKSASLKGPGPLRDNWQIERDAYKLKSQRYPSLSGGSGVSITLSAKAQSCWSSPFGGPTVACNHAKASVEIGLEPNGSTWIIPS